MKTLFIAPYSGLAEIAKKMDIQDDIDLDITIANLEEGVQAAKLAEKQGYEVIISRGGTATMIQNQVSIPVVHIDISGYDMLRVFTLIRGIKEGVALVGFANISQGAATICNILEYDVKMVTIQSRKEVREQLEKLKLQGFSVVIGDVVTVQVAQQVGLRGVLITSGKEAVMDALEEGRRVYDLFRKVNNQFYYLRETFNSIPLPIVLLDRDNKIVEKNLLFEEMVQSHVFLRSSTIPRLIKKVFDRDNQWIEIEEENRVYEVQAFVVNKQQAIAGLIIHETFDKGKAKAISVEGDPTHTPIIGVSEQAKQLRESINQYAYLDGNICLIGELGSGKHSIAEAIHFARYGQQSPIITIEGDHLTADATELDQLVSKLSSIEQGTIIFNRAETLTADMQKKLLNLLINKPDSMKFIALVRKPLDHLVRTYNFNEELCNKLTKYVLHLPSLRQRKADIGAFVDYFIAEFHAENGNETVGIRKEAVNYLEQYEWHGNLTQLKKVVRELSLTVSTNYIELFHVKDLMKRNIIKEQNEKLENNLSLQGTLEEIERKIIKQVLQEEGNNQTKTASRLGINRSTLWRKLQ